MVVNLGSEPKMASKWPTPPQDIEALGIPASMVVDLVLRFVREHGTGSLTGLQKALKLSYPVVNEVFERLRKQLLVEVKSASGRDYTFALTAVARELAAERAEMCRYAGPAPVPLSQYMQVVRSQRAGIETTAEVLGEAFADLVVTDELLDRLGPAIASQKPIFVYGPTGNGKTSIIERLPRILGDTILVPYALEVDGHIIAVFDPATHKALDLPPDDTIDPRWVRCHRPCVIAGGELLPAMLELRRDATSGVYGAPLQLKANNGLFLIDDLGRQVMSPRELFNRWMLALDRRVDFLSLQYGFAFQVPFEVMLVFSTNLDPTELGDDAFLRRIPNKIYIDAVSPESFDEIFARVLGSRGLPFAPEHAAHLREICSQRGLELRACYPGDICDILAATARYHRRPIAVTRQALADAAEICFAHRPNALASGVIRAPGS
jgi:hypothetical protein